MSENNSTSISTAKMELKKLSFKERALEMCVNAGERVLTKAFETGSMDLQTFMENVTEYNIGFDEISGQFQTPESESGVEFGRKEGAGNGSFKVSGFSLKMKMRDSR